MARGDRLLDLLLEIARDGFPKVFLWDEEEPVELPLIRGYRWLPGGAFRAREHPVHAAFVAALIDDPQLRVFAGAAAPFIQSSSGHGGQIRAGSLPDLLVASASAAYVAKGRPTGDLDAFLDEVAGSLEAFRRLIAGEEVEALTVVALDGITLREQARFETPWGMLRAAGGLEAGMHLGGVVPTAILTMARTVRFNVGDSRHDFAGFQAIQVKIDRAVELLPLAALLGIERDDYLLPGLVWSTNVEPVLPSGYQIPYVTGQRARLAQFHRPSPMLHSGGEALTEGEETRLREWADLVERRYDSAIQIAVQRTISALRERTDERDSLIDAVIALENLFGHGDTSEVSFRVTVALTLLLEPDPAKRPALRRELKDMYSARSTVIHGSKLTGKTPLSELKERAIRTAVESLRVLFADRPHFIPDRERGIRLILHTADPEESSPEEPSRQAAMDEAGVQPPGLEDP